jgi:hypothetical protein
MLSNILKSVKIKTAKGIKFQRLLFLSIVLYLTIFINSIAECGNVGESLSITELENLLESLTIEEQTELRQRYFDIAVNKGRDLEALYDEPTTSIVKWQAVVIFVIGTGILFLISRYGDRIVDMIRESSVTVIKEVVNISNASIEFFSNQDLIQHVSQHPEDLNTLQNLIIEIQKSRTS